MTGVRRPLTWVISLLCILTGCGVPTDPTPRSIPAQNVPFGLLDTTTTSTTAGAGRSAKVVIYLVKDGRLAPVQRNVAPPATPATVLAAMIAGPTPRETAAGLRSALISDVPMIETSGGIATVTLPEDLAATSDLREQILALAQLVYTMTELDGISGVRFLLHGQQTEIPTAQGSVKGGVITRTDFAGIAPVR